MRISKGLNRQSDASSIRVGALLTAFFYLQTTSMHESVAGSHSLPPRSRGVQVKNTTLLGKHHSGWRSVHHSRTAPLVSRGRVVGRRCDAGTGCEIVSPAVRGLARAPWFR